jgi:hypothetical protein
MQSTSEGVLVGGWYGMPVQGNKIIHDDGVADAESADNIGKIARAEFTHW